MRFVLVILCLVLLFGLNVTRDGIELPRVKLRDYVQRSYTFRIITRDEIIQVGVLKLTIFQVIYLMYNLYREYLFYPKRSSKSDQCSNSRDA